MSIGSFSITAEESEQLNKEYEINDILISIHKAINIVGGNTTLSDAYEQLKKLTRFADEVESLTYVGTASAIWKRKD